MEIEKLTILGFSEATLTMLLDILNSKGLYPSIEIINNLGCRSATEILLTVLKIR